jgi:hypothetical protein
VAGKPITLKGCQKDDFVWWSNMPNVADRANECLHFINAEVLITISVEAEEILFCEALRFHLRH